MQKIRTEDTAKMIIKEIEGLLKKGYKLTHKQRTEYEFAKIFLVEIEKRGKKKGSGK